MDEEKRKEFKIKFIKTAVLLNLLILFLAATVLVAILVPGDVTFNDTFYKTPLLVVLGAGTVIFAILTHRLYTTTRKWLEVHGKTKEGWEE
ncbi:MAG: hypothetical protein D5R99_05140 [Methanocalculus sp. MSAO_Arc1]|uniref:hypothetical protein n=1 Tax=Methanocalculus TaxID=71151 RepID=UPI000FF55175|nr:MULTISPECIES: hypothetical protein [unclassified Methanocalculus]MCP1662703.1 putative membrane protein YqjE [Methanocalculus sp. AMF5]RQD80272.1 MAG: hypothetical protein D5R99_05140 [Methanocalculus sp. MSAO_Arc1]